MEVDSAVGRLLVQVAAGRAVGTAAVYFARHSAGCRREDWVCMRSLVEVLGLEHAVVPSSKMSAADGRDAGLLSKTAATYPVA